jgi:hypothetical protein
LSLPIKERTSDGSIFITNCRVELDRLIEQSPDIPEDIISLFIRRFPEPETDASGNAANDFFRPEILDIRPIKIYRDIEAERKRIQEESRIKALKDIEEDNKRLEKVVKEREAERFQIIEETRREFEKVQNKQNKEVKKMFVLAQKQSQAEIVKKKYSVNNIEETMGDLMGALTRAGNIVDDSDSDESQPPVDDIDESQLNDTADGVEIIISDISGN